MKNLNHSFEALEARIAPAVLINPFTARYSDMDGDDVTVHFSKPLLTAANLTKILTFADGAARADGSVPQMLQSIDLTSNPAATGVNLSVTAVHSLAHGGDGRADVLNINAGDANNINSTDLGAVRVQGDLGFIQAGDLNGSTPAIKSLVVDSLGTNFSGTTSKFFGAVGKVVVYGDVAGNISQEGTSGPGIGSVAIGGTLGQAAGVAFSGSIESSGNIGSIKIGHNIVGSGTNSGRIHAEGIIGTMVVGGSIYGGAGDTSGFVEGVNGIGHLTIHGDVVGGGGEDSGNVRSVNGLARIAIGGNVQGGDGTRSGAVIVGDLPALSIGGSLRGGDGPVSGSVTCKTLGRLVVGGDIIGNGLSSTGGVNSIGEMGTVLVKGSIRGSGDTSNSQHNINGFIVAGGSIGSVTVLGNLDTASIAAGVYPGNDGAYGTGSGLDADFELDGAVQKIAQITIGGRVTVEAGAHAAIEATQLGIIKVGAVTYSHANQALDYHTGFSLTPGGTFLVREL